MKLHEQVKQEFTNTILLAESMRRECKKRGITSGHENGASEFDSHPQYKQFHLFQGRHFVSADIPKGAFNSKDPLNVTNLFNENSEDFLNSSLEFKPGEPLYRMESSCGGWGGAGYKQRGYETNAQYNPIVGLYTMNISGDGLHEDTVNKDVLKNGPRKDAGIVNIYDTFSMNSDDYKLEKTIKRLSTIQEHFRTVASGRKFEIPEKLDVEKFMD